MHANVEQERNVERMQESKYNYIAGMHVLKKQKACEQVAGGL